MIWSSTTINARVETVTTGKFFKQLWPNGRALLPSEGWYEWVKDFVIIAAASDQGMVDIHDRRPLVLSPEQAREWLVPGLEPERAEEIAREHCRPVEDFEWYAVGRTVGNVKNQGPELIEPLAALGAWP